MPGRGTPWRGAGQGKADRIGEPDILDGSITEADLDSSVTAKLNSTGGHEILDEGGSLPARGRLNFIGAGVVASDGIEDTTDVTIAGGGGGGVDRENGANPFTDFHFYDEFFYPDPTNGLLVHYEKSTFAENAPTNVEGGQVQINTSTGADNVARINTCGAGLLSLDPTKNFRLVWRASKNSQNATSAYLLGGYRDQGSKPGGTFPWSSIPADYVFFESDGTGNWFAKIHDGSTPQSTDTGITSDNSMHTFEIRSNPAVPNIEFLIDGATVATFTTNLPDQAVASFAGVMCNATSEALLIDSFYLYQDR